MRKRSDKVHILFGASPDRTPFARLLPARRFLPHAAALFIAALLMSTPAYADEAHTYEAEEIIVTASRFPSTFSALTRSVTVIRREEIESAPVYSVADLLDYALGVDARQRGLHGVQADVSMRGGTFEQTLILIDGVKVSDPQTGHHNLDLALTLHDIERIEILKGHGSRLYGPNAFGGVINIITKKGRSRGATMRATVGEHAFAEGSASLAYPVGRTGHRLSLAWQASDGYREDTEFAITTLSYGASLPLGPGGVEVSFGYADRKFGANSFYSDAFPDEWERTKTLSLGVKGEVRGGRVTFSPSVSWRRHKDDFILDRARPDWYRNRHTTDVYSVELQSAVHTALGASALGGEVGREAIRSSNLGDHGRTRSGLFVEHHIEPGGRFALAFGAFAYHYSGTGWKLWPGLDIGVPLAEKVRLYGSVGRAFRVPTYTELYYHDPANKGNPRLKPEEAWSYEAGFAWAEGAYAGEVSLFRRDGRNLIDYVRDTSNAPWEAHNITSVTTNGAEVSAGLFPGALIPGFPVYRLRLGYAFLDSDKETPSYAQSKYVLNHLRHQVLLDLAHRLPFGFAQTWKLRYEARLGDGSHVVVDTRIFRRIRMLTAFVEATNLFDAAYRDIGSIPMPGRWIRAGVMVNWGAMNEAKNLSQWGLRPSQNLLRLAPESPRS